jgi:hypothetical protein
MMKKFISISVFLLAFGSTMAQETIKDIYYLADTINVAKNDRVLEIQGLKINRFEYTFVFFCKCVWPNYDAVEFSYLVNKKNPQPKVVLGKPSYLYISYKSLMDLVAKHQRYFNYHYQLYITEVLPGNKYRTSKTNFSPQSEPRVNVTKLPK